MTTTDLDPEQCYRAAGSRDRRFDGVFYLGVTSTGIYCRPSCPARTPKRENCTFHRSAAAAQSAGFRACKRCLPDATPGSPEWDVNGDVAGRAMRLIADGVVDREGVPGLAARLGYTSRHLSRLLVSEMGAGPLALARANRAMTARSLIEGSGLKMDEIAFASGFSSVRQFNDTVRDVYAASPTQLRGRAALPGSADGALHIRIPVRTPFAGRALHQFLRLHLVAGIESADDSGYERSLALPHGSARIRLELDDHLHSGGVAQVPVTLWLTDLRDTAAATERARRILDPDCDPAAVAAAFARDPILGELVDTLPGLRVPGHPDPFELLVRTIVGQQISVAAAHTVLGRIVAAHGEAVAGEPRCRIFPTPEALAGLDPETLPMVRSRARTLVGVAAAVAEGRLDLHVGRARETVRSDLLALPGIGPWTADYVCMRGFADPDAFLPTDVGVRQALRALVADQTLHDVSSTAERWRPWRSYALLYLWHSLWLDQEDE